MWAAAVVAATDQRRNKLLQSFKLRKGPRRSGRYSERDVMVMADGGSLEGWLISGEARRGQAVEGLGAVVVVNLLEMHRFAAAWVRVRAAFGDG